MYSNISLGVYTALFCGAMYLIMTKRQSDLSRPTTWIMILMWVDWYDWFAPLYSLCCHLWRYSLATAHVFIALRRLVIALIDLQNKPPGPIFYLANIGDNLNRVKDLIYITNVSHLFNPYQRLLMSVDLAYTWWLYYNLALLWGLGRRSSRSRASYCHDYRNC